MSIKKFSLGVNFGRNENSAVLVVPNIKVRMEAHHFIYPPSLHDLSQEGFMSLPHAHKKKRTQFS